VASLASTYTATNHRSRGLAHGDLDRDGRQDLVISNCNEPVAVLMNESDTGNHWIGFKLRGKSNNRDGLGASVMLVQGDVFQIRTLYGGGSYVSSHELALHFGLGHQNSPVTIQIRWPGGQTQTIENLETDSYQLLVEHP